MPTPQNQKKLSLDWNQHKPAYDFVVIGSGYGGAITAARIAGASLQPKPSLCILERGREWQVGTFPDSTADVLGATRRPGNPLGLYELLNYRDISVIKGSGLGGTSLINANVAIVPDQEVFELTAWPRSMTHAAMLPYYDRARSVLAANPHPRAKDLAKVQALERRAVQIGTHAEALNIAVNFAIDGVNPHGAPQKPCIDCGDCVTGCNVGAKNTLYMNYLPMARNAGAEIYTQTKVEWIEKLAGGGWRIHGRHYEDNLHSDSFTVDAKNVILAAGAINSTEILMRSEMHGLKVSPLLGTGFSGNGDFFGLAYNGDHRTDVQGYGAFRTPAPGDALPPGPSIVGIVRYDQNAPADRRITIEDFSFPGAYIQGAKIVFAGLRGDDTDVGDEQAEFERRLTDADLGRPYAPDGALNHTMLYLVMGQDDARGTMVFETPALEPDGRMKIVWDEAGQQQIFTRMNEELRRHARALGASFISNPTWNVFRTGHLITAHPLGGCPMGEDHLDGAVDEFGRVFANDGSVHDGLFVADGAVIPSALGVNPFLTISAIAERVAERKVQQLGGSPYPKPVMVSMAAIDVLDVIGWREAELEKLFRRSSTQGLEVMVNRGGAPKIDIAARTIVNDRYWKGFFPNGHVLNVMSSATFTGFKKEFHEGSGGYTGITSDTDGRIRARNSLERVTLKEPQGSLEAGEYILLRYLDDPWRGFYDIFRVINEELLIGRVYFGSYPNGLRIFTFPMTRKYGFAQMTVDDHRALWETASVPDAPELEGAWRMDVVSNNNHLGSAAYLAFDHKPDGRLEARYQLMGLMEGLVIPSFTQDHFQLDDFTPFHDEIRRIDNDFMVGKYMAELPEGMRLLLTESLGIFHPEPDSNRFGFYYTLTRSEKAGLPVNRLLDPFLNARLPDGVGMTFDEEMVGWFFEGASTPQEGRTGDLTIADRIPQAGEPANAVACSFRLTMSIADVNEFVDGAEHEARLKGAISFGRFQGEGPVSVTIDQRNSLFNYLRVNAETGEAEMRYHLEFRAAEGRQFVFDGRKYMQKDRPAGKSAPGEVLEDYTTLYCHVYERKADQSLDEVGIAYLKFRTFEDLAATGNLIDFLLSFTITGTENPVLQLQARLRFLAFTGQFVQSEYDPLAPPPMRRAASRS